MADAEAAARAEGVRHRRWLAEMAAEPSLPIGTRVFVEEDGYVYVGVGRIASAIAERLRWAPPNVWMPEHALRKILSGHSVLPDPVTLAAVLLARPMSVHVGREPSHRYFVIGGDTARSLGLLTSESTPFVDAVVELRQVMGAVLPRLFHLSPATRNRGGKQLWP